MLAIEEPKNHDNRLAVSRASLHQIWGYVDLTGTYLGKIVERQD